MTSEIRANTLKNRVGLGTVSFTNTGPVVSGIVTANTLRLPDATSGSLGRVQLGNGLHLSMYHNGTNSFLVNNNGYLSIQSQAGVNGIFIARNAEVNLYYGPSVRLQTSSSGVTINRDLDVDGHTNLDNVNISGITTGGGFKTAGTSSDAGATNGFTAGRINIYDNNSHNIFRIGTSPSFAPTIWQTSAITFTTSSFSVTNTQSTREYININNSTGILKLGYGAPTADHGFKFETSGKGIKVGTGVTIETNGQANFSGISTFHRGIYITELSNYAQVANGTPNLDMPFVLYTHGGGSTGISTALFTGGYGNRPEVVFEQRHGGNFVDAYPHSAPWKVKWTMPNDNNTTDDQVEIKPVVNTGGAFQRLQIRTTDNSTGLRNTLNLSSSTTQLYVDNNLKVYLDSSALHVADYLGHLNDTDTRIGFPANDQISFETGGTERLRINSSGLLVPDGSASSNYISVGASQDLKLYHDGSHSYIRDTGTGGLRITTNSFNVLNSANNESMITATEDGAVKLYYNHNLRLETEGSRTLIRGSGGLGIYGDSGSNQNGHLTLHPTGSAVYTNLYFYNAAGNAYASIIGHAGQTLFFTGGTNGPLRFRVNGSGFHSFQDGNTERVRIDVNGRLSFAGDTDTYIHHPEDNEIAITCSGGSAPLFRVGTGGNNATVGIKTDSNLVTSGGALSVRGYTSFKSLNDGYAAIYTHNEEENNSTIASHILFNVTGANRGGFGYDTDNSTLIMGNQNAISFKTGSTQLGGTERLRITNDGKVGINHNNPNTQLIVRAPGGSGHASAQVHSGDSSTIMNMQCVQGSEGRFGMNTNHNLAIYTNGLEKLHLTKTGSLFLKCLDTVPVNQAESGHYNSTGYNAGHTLGLMVKRSICVSDADTKGVGGIFLSHTRTVACNGTTYNMMTLHNREGTFVGDVYVGFAVGGAGVVRHYKFTCLYSASTLTSIDNASRGGKSETISVNISSSNDAHFFQVIPNMSTNETARVSMTIVGAACGRNDGVGGDYYTVNYN